MLSSIEGLSSELASFLIELHSIPEKELAAILLEKADIHKDASKMHQTSPG
ncbi:hypothetical protein EV207_11046 [Scopulibacillus darangshiensis]|uniref:Uncharacterized protein n=1 Tax=Scopulibacillus darangshiensis TaxID=442528 RepID=A0A4R2P6K2_9BACL|nr:hypothetical protein [Scopulibacillus darangshiensis]TCP29425.1 hypothetical protein EV207_11046 [Scopulibacillus darangshiensis]